MRSNCQAVSAPPFGDATCACATKDATCVCMCNASVGPVPGWWGRLSSTVTVELSSSNQKKLVSGGPLPYRWSPTPWPAAARAPRLASFLGPAPPSLRSAGPLLSRRAHRARSSYSHALVLTQAAPPSQALARPNSSDGHFEDGDADGCEAPSGGRGCRFIRHIKNDEPPALQTT